jgi:nucleoside-diphosphate-sugar epimerase
MKGWKSHGRARSILSGAQQEAAGLTIIVSGAGGFIGQRLVRVLTARQCRVVALDTYPAAFPEGVRAVVGDIGAKRVRVEALRDGCSAIVHLATMPGGAAEADPIASRRVNLDAMYDLLEEAAQVGDRPRVVYASSIAVLGDPLPETGVDDDTPVVPRLIYGGHKAMMEIAVSMMHHRGAIDAVSVRLPGILARPRAPSGLKSAFMSELFHALRAGEAFVSPVSPSATMWLQSVETCVGNICHALAMDGDAMPRTRVVTLPALRVSMAELVAEVARQCDASPLLVSYRADAALEAAFGAQPPLVTRNADKAGFSNDGDAASLVSRALADIGTG